MKILITILLASCSFFLNAQLDDDFAISPNAVGHFQYFNNHAIFPSTKNNDRNEEMWQFRYFPLFIPRLNAEGDFFIEYSQLDSDTWLVDIHMYKDNQMARKFAYEKIHEIYREEIKKGTDEYVNVSRIKQANVFAIPVSEVKILSIDGIHKDVEWEFAKNSFNSIGANDLLKIRLKVSSLEDVILIKEKSNLLNIRLAFDLKSKKSKANSCAISYKDLQKSRLFTELSGIGSEGYVHRNDLRKLTKDITKEISISCQVEDGSKYQNELEIFNNILDSWVDNSEIVNFESIEFNATYDSDDLKPDVYERTLNEVYSKIESENNLETDKTGNLKIGLGKDKSFEGGGASKRIQFERLLNENKVTVEWTGSKFIPKNIELIRFNLNIFNREGIITSFIQYVSDNDSEDNLVDVDFGDFYGNSENLYPDLKTRVARLEEELMSIKSSQSTILPVGMICSYSTEYKSGSLTEWLPCDGRPLSREKYPILFNVIGYTWGGRGEFFNLPNLNGQFLRGIDKEGQVDMDADSRLNFSMEEIIGPKVGSYQGDATKLPSVAFKVSGETSADGNHTHHLGVGWGGGARNPGEGRADGNSPGNSWGMSEAGRHIHRVSGTVKSGGDSETRPPNVYVQFLIKVK